MKSKRHGSSHTFHKCSKSKLGSRTAEPDASSTKASSYQTSTSAQSRTPKTHVSNTSNHPPIASQESSQMLSSKAASVVSHMQKPHSMAMSAETQHYSLHYVEYEAAITNGTASLGFDIPAQLQQDLSDTNEQYRYWSVTGGVASHYGGQQMRLDPLWEVEIQYQQIVRYGYDSTELDGELAGIGAQFDAMEA